DDDGLRRGRRARTVAGSAGSEHVSSERRQGRGRGCRHDARETGEMDQRRERGEAAGVLVLARGRGHARVREEPGGHRLRRLLGPDLRWVLLMRRHCGWAGLVAPVGAALVGCAPPAAPEDEDEPLRQTASSIVGGAPTDAQARPYVVALMWGSQAFCTATV